MRVCYSKMHGCKDNPLVRSLFSWDKRGPYKWAPVYMNLHMHRKFWKVRETKQSRARCGQQLSCRLSQSQFPMPRSAYEPGTNSGKTH